MTDENANNQDEATGRPEGEAEPKGGPAMRQAVFLSERFAVITGKEAEKIDIPMPMLLPDTPPEEAERAAMARPGLISDAPALQVGFQKERIRQYRERQRRKLRHAGVREPLTDTAIAVGEIPEPPSPPPANNWIPIGPSVLRKGQAATQPGTSGRTPGIAVAPGGARLYIASANGGVWRSLDTGQTWISLMDAFDLNPTLAASDSLACGAIALVPGPSVATDRLYVGSGEGSGAALFGVGPIVSNDGGANWNTEPVSAGSLQLAGSGFYALAVDPNNTDRVVAATRVGVYRREPLPGGGGFHWDEKALPGAASDRVTSVVATETGGTTTFYAAVQNGSVYSSNDGNTWVAVGAGFPAGSARITLAAQPDNPQVVYAFLQGGDVWRLDTTDGNWIQATGLPAVDYMRGQGWYDLAVAVAPDNVNRIYIGGATVWAGGEWSGALYRLDLSITTAGGSITAVNATSTYIGQSVHADIHTIVFTPGDANKMWVGCDGGVFYSTNPTGMGGNLFTAKNIGLQTLTMNHLDQHPTEDAVVFCGSQDNGGERFTGEEAWLYSAGGDCGYYIVNWDDPYKVLNTYTNSTIRRSTDGGTRYSYTQVNVPTDANEAVLFYAPLVGTPRNTVSPAEANIVAFGSIRPWISTTFGGGWQSIPNNDRTDDLVGPIRSLVFASATKLYAGTFVGWAFVGGGVGWTNYTDGAVYRFDQAGGTWVRTRIDTGVGTDLPLDGSITDIAVDPSDATGNSIYITFGGTGDYRHVWHFDGTNWQQRSGPAAGDPDALLDVQHNAIITDPANPTHVFVGADIGVWRSTDSGATWEPFSEGLPDASVMDIKLHEQRRLLRVSTHGRSVWERTIDSTTALPIELYVRDTQLDQGRFDTINWLDDPANQGQTVRHWRGPDIKLDTPDAMGNYQFPLTGTIDFLQFVDELSDDFQNVATHSTATITTRVYVQVHNRGVTPADNVRVMLLLANASAGLPALPANYWTNVQTGTPINTPDWQTVGITDLDDVRVGAPKIAAFNLDSSMLPPPASLVGNNHHCVLALLHHTSDQYVSTQTNTDLNSKQERKAAHKNLTVVQFTGTLPTPPPIIFPLRINNALSLDKLVSRLIINLNGYKGQVRLVIPKIELMKSLADSVKGMKRSEKLDDFQKWAEEHIESIYANQRSKYPYNRNFAQQRIRDVKIALEFKSMFLANTNKEIRIDGIIMEPGQYHTVFLVIDRPAESKPGQFFPIEIVQFDERRKSIIGGLETRIEIVPEPKLENYFLRLWRVRLRKSVTLRARLYDTSGNLITKDEKTEVFLTMTTSNGRVTPLGNMHWHRSWKLFYMSFKPPLRPRRLHFEATAKIIDKVVAQSSIEFLVG